MKTILAHVMTIFLVTASHMALAQYDIVNKAEKALSKEKYVHALQVINKAIRKDSANAAAYQAIALYYTSTFNPAYHLDSAHFYNLKAIEYFKELDERALEKLHKNDITNLYLERFKTHIDSLAFQKAITEPTLVKYNHYIELYATSKVLDTAVALRNQLAFDEALHKNTYHSYRAFMEQYPDAIQIADAKARFEKLYFDESVKDGQLDSYYKFLEQHPQSAYRLLAEQQILELSTIDNKLSSYLNFVKRFPLSTHSKIALDYAYHIAKAMPDIEVKLPAYYDSLREHHQTSQQPLFPYYKNGYGFINSKGETIIPIPYKTEIQQSPGCPILFEDFIGYEVAGHDLLVTKSGQIFWKGDYDQVKDLGTGLIVVIKNNKHGVIHKSGKEVLPMIYGDIQIINNQFIAYQDNGLWGLASMLGRSLTSPIYQSISGLNQFILIQQEDQWAVTNSTKVREAVNTKLDLSFIYNDYEVFDNDHLMVFQEEKVNIISKELAIKLPLSTSEVIVSDEVLITRNHKSYSIVDPVFFKELAASDTLILSNKAGIFYQKDTIWSIWKNGYSAELNCDSLSLLGDHFIKCYQGYSLSFLPNSKLNFSKNATFINLQHLSEAFLLINDQQHLSLLNSVGDHQFLKNYTKVLPAGDSLLVVQKDRQKGLINTKGETILDIEYDAIQRNDSSTLTLLKNSKFGIYNLSDTTRVAPAYDQKIIQYDQSLYVASSDEFYGLIDHKGNTILPLEFDQLQYWNDSSTFVKKGYQWMIVNIQENQPVIEQINQYAVLNTSDDFQTLKIFKENGFGILDNRKGLLIPATFYNIHQLQQQGTTLYIAEKYIEEADFYVVVYYNTDGDIVFKHAMESEEYLSIICENP